MSGLIGQWRRILRRFAISVAAVGAAVLVAWVCAGPSALMGQPSAADAILLKYVSAGRSVVIQDSKWGTIGALQAAIDKRAAECGLAPITQDGRFTRETAEAARRVAECRGATIDVPGKHLTVEAWQAVTGSAPPSALERAQTLARTMEGADYDKLNWNVCVKFGGDVNSVLTWGPYGKTLGWGGELLLALKRVDRAVVLKAFADAGAIGGADLLDLKTKQELGATGKHRYPEARALMESICQKPGQIEAWRGAFARLGALKAVQVAYDESAWGEDGWFRYVVERLDKTWREAGLEPTEIDFAFFLDRSIHMGWGEPRFFAVRQALQNARFCLSDKAFTNARARLAVADAVRAKAAPADRMARDGIFLVDEEKALAQAMADSPSWPRDWRKLWRARAGVSAADFGLSDERPAPTFAEADSL